LRGIGLPSLAVVGTAGVGLGECTAGWDRWPVVELDKMDDWPLFHRPYLAFLKNLLFGALFARVVFLVDDWKATRYPSTLKKAWSSGRSNWTEKSRFGVCQVVGEK